MADLFIGQTSGNAPGFIQNLKNLKTSQSNPISYDVFPVKTQADFGLNNINNGKSFNVSRLFNFAQAEEAKPSSEKTKPALPLLKGDEVVADAQKTPDIDEAETTGNKKLTPAEREKLEAEYEQLQGEIDSYQMTMAVGKYEETESQRKAREDYPGIKAPPGRGLLSGELLMMSAKIARLQKLEKLLGIKGSYDISWRDKLVCSRQVDNNGRLIEIIPTNTPNDPEIMRKLGLA